MTAAQKKEQFSAAYTDHADEIFRYFLFRVYDRDAARELSQETFMKAWKYISEGKEVAYMKAFLYKIAYHLVVDRSRKKKEQSLDLLMEGGFDVPTNDKQRQQDTIDSMAALQEIEKLSDKYKEVLKMRYVDGLSPRDIAVAVGETENTVSVRIHRGMKQLRKHI